MYCTYQKASLPRNKGDREIVNHLTYAFSVSGHYEVLARHLEMVLPGTYSRSERWYILALCYSAAGMDDSALNIIRNGLCVLQRKGKPHIPFVPFGSKLCCRNPTHASEGIKFLNKAMKFQKSRCTFSVVYHFLGVCYGTFARSSTCDSEKNELTR